MSTKTKEKAKHNVEVNPPETQTGTAVALAGSSKVALPEGYTVARAVTLPSLSIKQGASYPLRIDSPMRVSKVKEKAGEEKKREPATICDATNVVDGEQYIFIVPAVVKENLTRDYPNNSYVGKVFQIANMGKRQENQRYFDFSILELKKAGE